jgi:hypothetical protein
MYSKTFLFVALVLVLAVGMGCGGGGDTNSGGDASSPIVGTWNRANSDVTFPKQIVFNANGTGSFIYENSNANTNITWAASGNQVTVSTGSAQTASITLSSDGNSFTLNSLGRTAPYNRA